VVDILVVAHYNKVFKTGVHMKLNKFLASAIIASTLLATVSSSFAGSIGRSGGSGSSRSSSSFSSSKSSVSSAPAPRPTPAAAPAPSKPGGIGGTTASVGVRKSEVTNSVRNDVAASKPAPAAGSVGSAGSTTSSAPSYTPTPSYSSPAPVVVQSGGGFGSSFMGSLGGTLVGNALFGNHGSHGGGTTVINNGTPNGNGSVSTQSGSSVGYNDSQFNPGGMTSAPKKEYTVWSFIADLFGFVIVVALLIGIAWIFYKGFQLVRNYVNKERGVSTQPFNPTQHFWEIQKAFAAAEVTALQKLLGPDIVDEMTQDLQPSGLTIKNVSHEVRLANNTEFSIWYKFFETDGEEVNQVWHYEKFGKDWKLNGIENV
jgi:hypothetical protein